MSGGCGVGERANQCNALARQVNEALAPVKQQLDEHPELARGSGAPEHYAELARRYTTLSQSTGAAQVDDPRIVDLRDDFVKLFEETSDACGDLGQSRSKNDLSARARAVRELKRLERRQESLLRTAKALCEPR